MKLFNLLLTILLLTSMANLYAEDDSKTEEASKDTKNSDDGEPGVKKSKKAYVHKGFFFRGQIGLGMGGVEHSNGTKYNTELFRVAITNLLIGGSVSDNLILYTGLTYVNGAGPRYSSAEGRRAYRNRYSDGYRDGYRDANRDIDCYEFGDCGSNNDAIWDYKLYGLALGLTYYFMPVNIYIGADLRLMGGYLAVHPLYNLPSQSYTNGRGISINVGKEWYTGREFSLGVALSYERATFTAKSSLDDTLSVANSTNYGILFSATYN